jgi:hypothetical protein
MMKANPRRTWEITLIGTRERRSFRFVGTCDAVLSEADVLECHVDYEVREFRIRQVRKLFKSCESKAA